MIFWGEDRMVQTVSGRMGSGNFEFYVSDYQKSELIEKKPLIQVQNSQVEIDGGFENENVFTLIEGKKRRPQQFSDPAALLSDETLGGEDTQADPSGVYGVFE